MLSRTVPPFLVCALAAGILVSAFAFLQTRPARVSAASCAEDAANLLQNGTMQGGAANSYGVVARKWKAFVVGAPQPHFENALNEGYDPNGSQYIWRDFDAWDAGIYQTVTTLTPGQNYHFWMVWGQALHDIAGNNARATLINRQIGVDVTGGTDPTAPSVVWSVPYYGGGGFNRAEWHLNFIASGTTATFFLRAQNGHTDGRNKVFFDTTCLRAVNGTPTSTPWSPTPAPTQTFTPSPTLTRTPTQTPIPGTKIDDTNAGITYGGAWTQGADGRALNGTYHYARGAKGAGVTASYTFNGTQVTIWYIGYKNRGRAKIKIDGVKVGVIDQYTPGVTFNLSRSFFNLAPGAHQLKIINSGAKNISATDSIIVLDAIEVPNTVAASAYKNIGARVTPTPTHTRVPPRLIPFARAVPAAPTPTDESVVWDPRLAGLNVYLETANVAPGALYWKLIRADYHDPFQHGGAFGGDHNMYYVITNENGARVANQKVWQSWPDDAAAAFTNADGIADIPMWANYFPANGPGPYNGYVDGLPSDVVRGMGLPANNHVSFILYFQKTFKGANGSATATPTVTLTNTPPPTATPTLTATPTEIPPSVAPTATFTPTTPPASKLIDDSDSSVIFSAGWSKGTDAKAIHSTYHYARGAKGAAVKIGYAFSGTAIKLWYIGYKNRGKMIVRLDGIKVAVLDQYTPGVTYNLSRTFDGLGSGAHTLKLVNRGNKNLAATDSIIVLDALEISP